MSVEPATRCLFCGSTDGKRSKEHILRRSFEKVFPKADELWFSEQFNEKVTLRKRPIGQFDLVLKAVCRDCNHGWLESLEDEASDMISQLVFASGDAAFRPHCLERLGLWFYVRALLRTHLSPEGRAPIRLFEEVFASKTVPTACDMKVGLCESSIFEAGAHQSVLLGRSRSYVAHVGIGLGPLLFLATIHDGQPEGAELARCVAEAARTWFPGRFLGLNPVNYPGRVEVLTELEGKTAAVSQAILMGMRPPLDQLGNAIDFKRAIPSNFHSSLRR
ncbi:hypothetical protein ACIQC5_14415 [Paenarthrobacter sp. NPDC092416]|uniref:hypothetical protein n=1 Tax=Paenarthrobacter sp. NPDC092416 TaxID=3364386 RepID=UPI00381B8D45